MDKKLHKKLIDREEKGTLRSLSLSSEMIDFGSNDYLGLSRLGISNSTKVHGSTGSRLITGNDIRIESTEQTLASFFGAEAALCFNSGYDANVGLFSSVPQRTDIVLYDEHIHASVRDGIRLGLAKAFSFKHNDVEDLHRLLEKHADTTIYVALEALYSMSGDVCPLLDIVTVVAEYDAYIVLDEAHSAGVFGEDGRGFAHALELHKELLIRLVTFGKAYGAHGAVILCENKMKSYLINFARSLIYTTALPLASYDHMQVVVMRDENKINRDILQSNLAHFRSEMGTIDFVSAVNSPIQIIRFESIDILKRIENQIASAGFYAKAIYAPTVPEGSECLRVCIHSFNSTTEINQLCSLLRKA